MTEVSSFTESSINYMPETTTDSELKIAHRICADDKLMSDSSGLPNRDKWEHVKNVFDCDDCSIFSAISFEDVYATDNAIVCEAAAFVADLRVQYLESLLQRNPRDTVAHHFFVRNKQWYVRMRERIVLQQIEGIVKTQVIM